MNIVNKKIISGVVAIIASLTSMTATATVVDFESVSSSSLDPVYEASTPSTDGTYSWTSGGVTFSFEASYSGWSWSGFKATQSTDTVFNSSDNDLTSVTGSGSDGSNSYATLYNGNYTINVGENSTTQTAYELYFSEEVYLVSIDICNTVYSYNSMLSGDTYATALAGLDGDAYIDLNIYGIDSDGTYTLLATETLASKTDGVVDISDEWISVSLESLDLENATYEGIAFEFEVSNNAITESDYGDYMTYPTYISIDNLTYVVPEPSTYAMIFGSLALGLAIYRRRKS